MCIEINVNGFLYPFFDRPMDDPEISDGVEEVATVVVSDSAEKSGSKQVFFRRFIGRVNIPRY
jgi:hypothetical protein